MARRSLLIYGAGGHGKVVADAAQAAGWDLLGHADDSPEKAGASILGVPVVATSLDAAVTCCRSADACVVVALGDNRVRQRVFEILSGAGLTLASVIHPSAVIAPSAVLGAGTVVMAGAVINPASTIGKNVIVNTGSTIDHDNVIGDHAHVAPGVHTGGAVSIGAGAMLGVGAAVRNGISIGEWSIVGVGAAVVASIPPRAVAYGNPARVSRELP